MHHSNVDFKSPKFISWHAVITGALVALGLTFLFNLLTTGLSLSMFTSNEQDMQAIGFIGFAWLLIGGYILLFLAGWVTGRLIHPCYSLHRCNGALHGFVMWSIYLILSILLLSNMTEASIALLRASFSTLAVDPAVNVVQETRNAGLSTIASFLILLAGAIGASIGAYYGIGESKKCCDASKLSPAQKP